MFYITEHLLFPLEGVQLSQFLGTFQYDLYTPKNKCMLTLAITLLEPV